MNDLKQSEFLISPWVVMLAFTFLVGAFALQFHLHYPDEMYYTDAAVRMMQTGDFLTPYLGDEGLRFKKPILSYWAVLVGFKIFGITPFASRIFFLLAGTFTIGLVYLISRITFKDPKIAGLSALIIASHPVFIFSATRSIPDILLAFFMTLSGVGLAGLLKWGDKAPQKYIWIFYLGLSLAFEVKGLPAVALGGIGIIYLKFNPWQTISWKKLLNLPAILCSAYIAVFWFAAMYRIHGAIYLDSFFEDQVGMRVSSKALQVIGNLILGVVLMIVLFLPWLFFGIKNLKTNWLEMKKENMAFTGFVLVWVLSILLMTGLVSKFYERYLLPVLPLTSVWLAWWLINAGIFEQKKGQKTITVILLSINFILILAGLFLNIGLEASPLVFLGIGIGVLLWIYLLGLWLKEIKLLKTISYAILLLFYLGSFVTYQISLPDQGTQVKSFVLEKNIPKESRIGFIGHLHTGSKIRIGFGKEYILIDLPQADYDHELTGYPYLIVEDRYLNNFDETKYQVQLLTTNWDPKILDAMIQGILYQNPQEVLNEKGKKFYWVTSK